MDIDKKTDELLSQYQPSFTPPYRESISEVEDRLSTLLTNVHELSPPSPIGENKGATVLREEYLHPWTIFAIMTDLYGDEWIGWEPETIFATVDRELGFQLNEIKKNQIGAIKSILMSDQFWRDYRVFGWTCYGWNNEVPDFRILPAPTPGFMLSTVATASFVRTVPFLKEVELYIENALKHHGSGSALAIEHVDRPHSDLIESYLDAPNDEIVNDILEEAENNSDQYALRTIGMIDYYMTRLTMLKDQMNRLFGGFTIA